MLGRNQEKRKKRRVIVEILGFRMFDAVMR